MKHILSLIAALFFLCSCSKENILKPENGQINAYWVSEKMDINKVRLRLDTSKVNRWYNISQKLADELKASGIIWIDFTGCSVSPIPELPSFKWEKMYWIIEYK